MKGTVFGLFVSKNQIVYLESNVSGVSWICPRYTLIFSLQLSFKTISDTAIERAFVAINFYLPVKLSVTTEENAAKTNP